MLKVPPRLTDSGRDAALRRPPGTVTAWQARLLGVAGLLPPYFSRAGPDQYLRGLWDHWWRERESFSDVLLPRNLWRFSGLRPANQPQRRLALAAHWLSTNDFLPRLERWFTAPEPAASLAGPLRQSREVGTPRRGVRSAQRADPTHALSTTTDPSLPASLLACLQAPEDDFWSWHWGLRSPRLGRPQPLLGATRVTDLAVNVILPWF
jgi:hypothetical protein